MVQTDLFVTVQQADYISQPDVQVLWKMFAYMVSYLDFFVAFDCLAELCGSLLPDKLLQWEKDVLLFSVGECWYSYKTDCLVMHINKNSFRIMMTKREHTYVK